MWDPRSAASANAGAGKTPMPQLERLAEEKMDIPDLYIYNRSKEGSLRLKGN